MKKSLNPGENSSLNASTGQVTISHRTGNGLDINLTAFLLTASGKTVDDSDMVFFNAQKHSSGAATFIQPESKNNVMSHSIHFDLSKLPVGITKIAIALTQDGSAGGFSEVKELRAEIKAGEQTLELAPGSFNQETGIIVLELYVRNDQFKARSVWQGFASGLVGLCNMYGVEVEDTPMPATTSAEKNTTDNALISMDKPEDRHRISLIKGTDAPKKITISATWIDNGDGRDNDDLDLRVGILWPDGNMSLIQAPDKSGAFNKKPWVYHTGDVVSASLSAPGVEKVEINPEISRLAGGKVALVCSVYSAVSNGAVSVASLKPKMRMEYGDRVVECSFDFTKKKGFLSSCIYTYVIGLIEIDQDAIELRPSGVTSKPKSEATPWLSRQKDNRLELTMNGPAVFKGEQNSGSWGKNYVDF
ncbi:TerD family protein [Klebsiella aerogenes]|uniref:TerD family protein n=1 Tax=Klebsiella aerogenes TaxID=548 RepID=UPI00254BC9A9|nr:TerD family protein [Klebsiella aerogenes]MEC5624807.1 TerD family protein [Klebsiella aerogenes]